ncbi:hypothetical protein ACFE04_014441 [Oxalis oulophora]
MRSVLGETMQMVELMTSLRSLRLNLKETSIIQLTLLKESCHLESDSSLSDPGLVKILSQEEGASHPGEKAVPLKSRFLAPQSSFLKGTMSPEKGPPSLGMICPGIG